MAPHLWSPYPTEVETPALTWLCLCPLLHLGDRIQPPIQAGTLLLMLGKLVKVREIATETWFKALQQHRCFSLAFSTEFYSWMCESQLSAHNNLSPGFRLRMACTPGNDSQLGSLIFLLVSLPVLGMTPGAGSLQCAPCHHRRHLAHCWRTAGAPGGLSPGAFCACDTAGVSTGCWIATEICQKREKSGDHADLKGA